MHIVWKSSKIYHLFFQILAFSNIFLSYWSWHVLCLATLIDLCCEMRLFLLFSNTVRSFDFFAVQVSKIPLCLHRHHHPNVRLAVLQNIGQKVTISNFALWDLRSSEALSVYLHAQLCPLDDWLKLISIFFRSVPNFIFQLQSCSVCEEESYGVVSPCVTSNAVKCDN